MVFIQLNYVSAAFANVCVCTAHPTLHEFVSVYHLVFVYVHWKNNFLITDIILK